MGKDYRKWHKLKKQIHYKNKTLWFRERDIWWCSLGVNIGSEQDGKHAFFERPVLVFKKFNSELFWAIPLTSKAKNNKYHLTLSLGNIDTFAILSQLRLISAKRLLRYSGKVSRNQYATLKKAIIELILQN